MNAVEYIHSLQAFGKKAGLRNIMLLLDKLGNPHKRLEYIHISGTNGKGSVSSMINSIFLESGKKVGLFTSPFIERFNERICVNNKPISDNDLERITLNVKNAVDALSADDVYCTVFDVICAVGFTYFSEQQCDVVVLEVGLGGRFDATNIIDLPLCAVICAIGYDHTQYLGETLPEIAYEKCGIIKKGHAVVSYPIQREDVFKVIEKSCNEKKAVLSVPDVSKLTVWDCGLNGAKFTYCGKDYEIGLVGEYQVYNALCAIEAAYVCGVDYEIIRKALKDTTWKCRFEIFKVKDKLLILDGAHNPHGITAFCNSAEKFFADKKIHYIFGMLNDKDIEKSCDALNGTRGKITVTSVPSQRSNNPKAVYRCLSEKRDNSDDIIYIEDNIKAISYALLDDCDVVCVIGSLYMVGNMRKYVEMLSGNDKTR